MITKRPALSVLPALSLALLASPVWAQIAPSGGQTAASQVPAQPATQPVATPAFVPSAPALRFGVPVAGPGGLPVGVVVLVENGVVTLDTGRFRVPLPQTSFGYGPAGPTLPVTQLQLNALVEAQVAAAFAARDAALIVGAPVRTFDGQLLGTVQTVEGERITVLRPAPARRVLLARSHLALDASGLVSRQTLAEIESGIAAAVAAEQAAAAAAAAAAPTNGTDRN